MELKRQCGDSRVFMLRYSTTSTLFFVFHHSEAFQGQVMTCCKQVRYELLICGNPEYDVVSGICRDKPRFMSQSFDDAVKKAAEHEPDKDIHIDGR